MRLAVRKKWQIQARSGNCVYPIMMDDCKCGKTITYCVVVTPLSPVNGPSVSRFLTHAQLGPYLVIISFSSTARILLTENCIVFATTGHVRLSMRVF